MKVTQIIFIYAFLICCVKSDNWSGRWSRIGRAPIEPGYPSMVKMNNLLKVIKKHEKY